MADDSERVQGFIGNGEMLDISHIVRLGRYAANAGLTLLSLYSIGLLRPLGESDPHNVTSPDGYTLGATLVLSIAEGIRRISTRT
ncbi:MAG: hypothetical protein JWO47_675 [Candidatus Saccharibacteria bacterium]|nr:hypothetical protein [Candidatus Saccharibacteria bacterium]